MGNNVSHLYVNIKHFLIELLDVKIYVYVQHHHQCDYGYDWGTEFVVGGGNLAKGNDVVYLYCHVS